MRYLFRTHYRQDIALWRHNGDRFWYGLLAVLVLIAPLVLGEFYIGELGAVFIFAIAGVGLMLLVGYTGLISLGHAAFLGIGAYVNAVLLDTGRAVPGHPAGRRAVHRAVRCGDRPADLAHERAVSGDRDPGVRQHRRHGVPEMDRRHRRLRRLRGADAVRFSVSRSRARPASITSRWSCWCSCCGLRPICCGPRSAGPWSRSATARSPRKAWASTWLGTRRWRSRSARA